VRFPDALSGWEKAQTKHAEREARNSEGCGRNEQDASE
jgi:hypothetical protein